MPFVVLCFAKLGRAATRLIITASHNPILDNDVKITNPDDGMLDYHWESFVDALANTNDTDALLLQLHQFSKDEGVLLGGGRPQVLLGRDTRPIGEYLLDATLQICHADLLLCSIAEIY
jgi:phosphoacetylglucosamine mutase